MDTHLDLVARSPEDLLACVPLSLGFVPEESVVMLGLGGTSAPHARIDLGTEEDLPQVCRALVAPAVQHRADRVVLSLWTDLDRAAAAAPGLHEAFGAAGIEVVATLACDGRSWARVGPTGRGEGRPFDVLAHPFVAEAVVAGRVVHRSREALADSLRVVPIRVRAAARALLAGSEPEPADVRRLVAGLVGSGAVPSPRQVADLVRAASRAALRDELWCGVPRSSARRHVDLWIGVVRSTPPPLAAAPASVLAALAWRSGDGALAWCALDVAAAAAVPCPLAGVVRGLLEGAVAPDHLPGRRRPSPAPGSGGWLS